MGSGSDGKGCLLKDVNRGLWEWWISQNEL
jgi:hypothetical protein